MFDQLTKKQTETTIRLLAKSSQKTIDTNQCLTGEDIVEVEKAIATLVMLENVAEKQGINIKFVS